MKLVYALAVVIGIGVAACGPSGKQIQTAKAQQYKAPPKHMLDVSMQVAQQTYKIGEIDIEGLKFATKPQWYTPTGGRISAYEERDSEFINAGGGDVQVWFVVKIRPVENERVVVEVIPRAFQLITGSAQPRELKPDDPNLPGWVLGRVDSLAMAIYEEGIKHYRQ